MNSQNQRLGANKPYNLISIRVLFNEGCKVSDGGSDCDSLGQFTSLCDSRRRWDFYQVSQIIFDLLLFSAT